MPCSYCGQSFQPTPRRRRATIDHVFPKSRFYVPLWMANSSRVANVVPACCGCNEEKGDLTLSEWELLLAQRNDPRLERVRELKCRYRSLEDRLLSRNKPAKTSAAPP